MKAFVILNPVAGKKARESVLEALKTQFSNAEIEYVVHETTKEDKPGDVVRERLEKEKFDFVVAAGGDGTVSQVIGGLVGGITPLAIIPVGTGNLLARDLSIPLEVEDAVALIVGKHEVKKIDAMRVNHQICILNASVGISAKVMKDTTSESKNRFGFLAYLWKALGKLFKMKRESITVDIDGKPSKHHAVEVTVFNCGIIAETLYPKGPDIRMDDGQLDVWIVSAKTIKDYPLYLLRMLMKRPSKDLSHVIKANERVVIKSSAQMPLQADGEVMGTAPVEIEILSGAIDVFVSEK